MYNFDPVLKNNIQKIHLVTKLIIWLPYFTQIMIFSPNTSFWMKKGVIWLLFHDDLRAKEREEKETTNSVPKQWQRKSAARGNHICEIVWIAQLETFHTDRYLIVHTCDAQQIYTLKIQWNRQQLYKVTLITIFYL